jgi:Ca-activated chloride channel family protein
MHILRVAVVAILVSTVAAPARQRDELRLERDLVTLDVTVTDREGNYVTGLDRSRFEVLDDGVRQEIAFFSDEDRPISIAIVVDVSRSMERRIEGAREALLRFVETSHKDDEFFLVTFADRPEISRTFAVDGKQIVNDLLLVRPGGDTALYDAVVVALERLETARHSRRAILLLTDGQDNHSRYSYGELRDRLEEASAVVYAIGITEGPYRFGGSRGGAFEYEENVAYYTGKKLLNEVTKIGGGRAFFPVFTPTTNDHLLEACIQIALELRRRYAVGYYPSRHARDGRFHRVKVTATTRDGVRLTARTRPGYVAPRK